jgi:hypothetical protein
MEHEETVLPVKAEQNFKPTMQFKTAHLAKLFKLPADT